jgi:hypothetical protein
MRRVNGPGQTGRRSRLRTRVCTSLYSTGWSQLRRVARPDPVCPAPVKPHRPGASLAGRHLKAIHNDASAGSGGLFSYEV